LELQALIVEQLEVDGTIRSFKMDRESGQFDLIVSFADEYDEPRDGPFHFHDEEAGRRFSEGFAQCRRRKIGPRYFFRTETSYHVELGWSGIPTAPTTLSYYALSLPENAIPTVLSITNPRAGKSEYRRTVSRDDKRLRYVIYLECSSPAGRFDFELSCDFEIDPEQFKFSEYQDPISETNSVAIDEYRHFLAALEAQRVNQYLSNTDQHIGAQFLPKDAEKESARRAEALFEEAKALTKDGLKNADQAKLLIEKAEDAIKEFGNTNQDKKLELKKWKEMAALVIPPSTLEDLKKRSEGEFLSKVYPKSPALRNTLFGIVILILIVGVLAGLKNTFSSKGAATLNYGGQVVDRHGTPISGATVRIRDELGNIQEKRADSLGKFDYVLPSSIRSVCVSVESTGYEKRERCLSPEQTAREPVVLSNNQGDSEVSATPAPMPTRTPIKAQKKCTPEERLLGKC
jgi:hypothetical protein